METQKPTQEEREWKKREQRIWELQQKILQSQIKNMSMEKARWLAMRALSLA
jgi:hypothetical protein